METYAAVHPVAPGPSGLRRASETAEEPGEEGRLVAKFRSADVDRVVAWYVVAIGPRHQPADAHVTLQYLADAEFGAERRGAGDYQVFLIGAGDYETIVVEFIEVELEALDVAVLSDVDGISFTFFNAKDVVRHPLVQKVVRAYEDFDREQGDDR